MARRCGRHRGHRRHPHGARRVRAAGRPAARRVLAPCRGRPGPRRQPAARRQGRRRRPCSGRTTSSPSRLLIVLIAGLIGAGLGLIARRRYEVAAAVFIGFGVRRLPRRARRSPRDPGGRRGGDGRRRSGRACWSSAGCSTSPPPWSRRPRRRIRAGSRRSTRVMPARPLVARRGHARLVAPCVHHPGGRGRGRRGRGRRHRPQPPRAPAHRRRSAMARPSRRHPSRSRASRRIRTCRRRSPG